MKTYELLAVSLLAIALPLACDSDDSASASGEAGAAGTASDGGQPTGGQPSNGAMGGEGLGEGGPPDAGAAPGGAPASGSSGGAGGDGSVGGDASGGTASGGAAGAPALEEQFTETATTICETASSLDCANEATCVEYWETGYVVDNCVTTWRAYIDCVAALEVGGLACDEIGDVGPNFETEGAACIEPLIAHGNCVGG